MSIKELWQAIRNNDTKVSLQLVQQPDIKKCINQEIDGYTCLHNACSYNNPDIREALLQIGAQVDKEGLTGRTALHRAAECGYEKCMDILISHDCDCDVNAQDDFGNTALHYAAENGYASCVRLLALNVADLDICDSYSKNSLHLAALKGNLECVKMLLKHGCSAGATISNGRHINKMYLNKTAFDLAEENGHTKVAECLAVAMK